MHSPNRFALTVLLGLSAAAYAQPLPEGWPTGARIPAISGTVVDAITLRPIPNLDVTLRAHSATGTFFGSGEEVLRYENVKTTASGRFAFATSLESLAGPLTSIKSYWLSVNFTFWSIPWMKTQSRQTDIKMDPVGDDLSSLVMRDPLLRAKATTLFEFTTPGARVNTRAYFPMAVQFRRPCKQAWNANCLRFDDTESVQIPLIPVLNDPASCGRIADPDLREQCRQLNTYRQAFLQQDATICRKVEEGPASEACRDSLKIYLANPGLFNRQ